LSGLFCAWDLVSPLFLARLTDSQVLEAKRGRAENRDKGEYDHAEG